MFESPKHTTSGFVAKALPRQRYFHGLSGCICLKILSFYMLPDNPDNTRTTHFCPATPYPDRQDTPLIKGVSVVRCPDSAEKPCADKKKNEKKKASRPPDEPPGPAARGLPAMFRSAIGKSYPASRKKSLRSSDPIQQPCDDCETENDFHIFSKVYRHEEHRLFNQHSTCTRNAVGAYFMNYAQNN
jgi:hypothetical protein